MRIVSGKYRGRRFSPPRFFKARPTTDFAKESLFNVLNNIVDIEGARVLDLFAGTGSISYEFMSRGAEHVCAVDINGRYLEYIKKNAEMIAGDENIISVRKANVFSFIEKQDLNYDIIFADPPYDLKNISKIPQIIFENEKFNKKSVIILEHSKHTDLSDYEQFTTLKKYGKVNFSFFY